MTSPGPQPVNARRPDLPMVAALTTVVLWASAFVGIRAAGRSLSPISLTLARLVVGSAVLGLFILIRRERLPGRRELPSVAAIGVLWFGFYNVALNEAERHIDAGTAALLVNVAPVLIAVLSGLLLKEGLPRRLITGCAIALAGCALIAYATSTGGASPAWALLCLACAMAYAVALIIQKPLLGRASALSVTWLACSVGAVLCLPFFPGLFADASHAPAGALAWAVYLGVAPTALGFTLWAYALSHMQAGRLGVLTYLVPPLAVLCSWLLLGEVPPFLALIGGGLCLGGVIHARRGPAAPQPSASPAASGD